MDQAGRTGTNEGEEEKEKEKEEDKPTCGGGGHWTGSQARQVRTSYIDRQLKCQKPDLLFGFPSRLDSLLFFLLGRPLPILVRTYVRDRSKLQPATYRRTNIPALVTNDIFSSPL